MFTHILLASDGSECALKAAEVAVTLAGKFASRLTIINVHQVLPTVGPFGEVVNRDTDEECRDALQENAVQSAGRIADSHGVPYLGLKEIGLPDAEIVRGAQEKACDLIVLGSRGLNAFQSFLLGSISDHVTHHAHCPIFRFFVPAFLTSGSQNTVNGAGRERHGYARSGRLYRCCRRDCFYAS